MAKAIGFRLGANPNLKPGHPHFIHTPLGQAWMYWKQEGVFLKAPLNTLEKRLNSLGQNVLKTLKLQKPSKKSLWQNKEKMQSQNLDKTQEKKYFLASLEKYLSTQTPQKLFFFRFFFKKFGPRSMSGWLGKDTP